MNNSESNVAKANLGKRRKFSILIYTLSLGIGAVIGFAYVKFERGTLGLSNEMLIAITAVITIFLYYLTLIWYRNMDEFERQSFNQAGNITFHVGFLAFPWFVLHRLELLPMLDAVTLMVCLSFVFLSVYYYRKFF
ncbi:MAG: hypothetical protein HKN88_02780 [Gammaproteobacteria bacterium]|nr:hypothetical protein [Gammaproteobacteria bacterium]NNC96977.1 hypothetical protein [Gammaproteobacteria bacterium]NNM13422.1 hypothetical protein [Gammaproteobacteria bacterium]